MMSDSNNYLIVKQNKALTKQEKLERRQKNLAGRPYIQRRMFTGIFDFLLVFIIVIGLEVIQYFAFFDKLGFNTALNRVDEMNAESHLFYQRGVQFLGLARIYEGDELNEKIDEAVVYFYSHDERAIESNRLDSYNSNKLASHYYNDDLSVKDNVSTDDLHKFLAAQYESAIKFFNESDELIENRYKVNRIITYSAVVSFVISSTIFYFIIPLSRKEGETLMMMLFKICVVNYSDRLAPKKHQILVRNLLFVVFTFYIPILFYIAFGTIFLITDLAIFALIIFYKENRGPHELASKTIVILKRRADALDTLKAMGGGTQ